MNRIFIKIYSSSRILVKSTGVLGVRTGPEKKIRKQRNKREFALKPSRVRWPVSYWSS